MSQSFRSPITRIVLSVVGVSLFYFVGVLVRQHSGVLVVIRNESTEPVRELSVQVENKGERHHLQDLVPGDHESVFVRPIDQSPIVLDFAETGHEPRSVNVYDHSDVSGCGTSTVRILPPRNTESEEVHRAVCWNSWLDFM
jgi:hypothetical protein